MGVSSVAGLVVAAWAWGAIVFTAVALVAALRVGREFARSRPPRRWPTIWVLRPCEGDEPGLRENLASSLCAYEGKRRVLLLVPSEGDPSYAAAMAVASTPHGVRPDVDVVVTGVTSTRNRKSAHLAVGLARAVAACAAGRADAGQHSVRATGLPDGPEPPDATPREAPEAPEVIVQADSDVRLDDRSLSALLAALGDDEETAASFALPVELAMDTAGDLAASGLLSASLQDFLVLAGLARFTGGVVALSGALAAHRIGPLVETGGFASLEHLLGEDFEVGRRLHDRGLKIAISAEPARCVDEGRSVAAVLSRTSRWIMVVRRQRGALVITYPLLLAPTPILVAAAAVVASFGDWVPAAFVAGLVALRTVVALVQRRLHNAPVGVLRAFSLSFAAECLMLVSTVLALRTPRVIWRGRKLRIGPGGTIDP